jgi:predicted dienelactone hydrolase
MDSTLSPFRALAARLLLAAPAVLLTPAGAAVNHDLVISPLSPGRFEVACSNIEQDEARIAQFGVPPANFWNGTGGRYLTEILAHPSSALRIDAVSPDLRQIYPGTAGSSVEYVAIVCHPTTRANPDPHYALPGTDDIVPHMLPAGAQPRLITLNEYYGAFGIPQIFVPEALGPARLPLIVYSHGLAGSPIGKGYMGVMVQLAAQGYMVAAIFHGDPRFSRVRLEDFRDYWYALTNFDRIAEMMLLRPVALRAMTDVLLGHPGYAPGIDTQRIGGFGASMGGQSMAHLLGARMSTSLGLACRETVRDPRIRAAFAYVPYTGQTWLPSFCDDQRGAEGVDRPFMAMTGSQDSTSPQMMAEQAVNRMKGSRYLVSLLGGEHELRPQDTGDLFTWMLTFFNAYLDVPTDRDAMARLIRMAQVQGGREDSLVIDVHVPTAFDTASHEAPAREFYNVDLDHYFMAAWQGEVDIILAGGAGPGWILTGESFKVFRQMPPDTITNVNPVCRFYGVPAGGPNSHFFTASPGECEFVKSAGGWFYEGIGFNVFPQQSDGRCPAGMLGVRRAYNDRFRNNDSNHRFSTSDSTMKEMSRRGWIVEGTAWCSRP